ncbi:MAG: acyl carrier protein [Candidatus Omnitrophica bacterium]|nr:acyl carrier protein [Candidatus Omnitrophota bacterium]
MDTRNRIKECLKEIYTASETKHFSYCAYPIEKCSCRNIDDIDNDTSLLNLGYIDSMGLMELIVALDKEFRIEIQPQHIILHNFDSIDKIYKTLLNYKLS